MKPHEKLKEERSSREVDGWNVEKIFRLLACLLGLDDLKGNKKLYLNLNLIKGIGGNSGGVCFGRFFHSTRMIVSFGGRNDTISDKRCASRHADDLRRTLIL
jgi:hypothetical protein